MGHIFALAVVLLSVFKQSTRLWAALPPTRFPEDSPTVNDVFENLALARLQQLIGWGGVLVTMGAAAMVASYLRRSRWAAAIAAGFGLMTVNHIASLVLIPWIIRSNPSRVATQVGMASFGMSVVGLIALATLVLGVMGTLSELSRATRIREP